MELCNFLLLQKPKTKVKCWKETFTIQLAGMILKVRKHQIRIHELTNVASMQSTFSLKSTKACKHVVSPFIVQFELLYFTTDYKKMFIVTFWQRLSQQGFNSQLHCSQYQKKCRKVCNVKYLENKRVTKLKEVKQLKIQILAVMVLIRLRKKSSLQQQQAPRDNFISAVCDDTREVIVVSLMKLFALAVH